MRTIAQDVRRQIVVQDEQMGNFRILFHGQFAKVPSPEGAAGGEVPYEGFYASRLLTASSADAAIVRGRELIREELDATLLHGRQGELLSLDAEEVEVVGNWDDGVPNRGFTFY